MHLFNNLKPLSSNFIAGIGTDLLSIERIECALKRKGIRFASKVLGAKELQIFYLRREKNLKNSIDFLSSRFALKEAFSKAIGIGMTMPMAWHRVQIINSAHGKPKLMLSRELSNWCKERCYGTTHISISHERNMVVANVVIEYGFHNCYASD